MRSGRIFALFLAAAACGCGAPRVTPPAVHATGAPVTRPAAGVTPAPVPSPMAGIAQLTTATPLPTPPPSTLHLLVDDLVFAVVGDTRPAYPDDTRGYPTDTITAIWRAVQAETPHPRFAVGTGDYVFATAFGRQAAPQLDLYLGARAAFDGPVYFAMGNHECTGMTASNCGAGTKDGETRPYVAFLSKMLSPVGVTKPWYTLRVDAKDGSWTSKFVFVAPNAWTSEQEAWLDEELSQDDTTYTFVVRHEGARWWPAPGVRPSNRLIEAHPPTLSLVGHVHTYRHDLGEREIVIGNGGAPLTGDAAFGYAIVKRRASDGAIEVSSVRLADGDRVDTFAVAADGSPAE